jgi:cytochrome c551
MDTNVVGRRLRVMGSSALLSLLIVIAICTQLLSCSQNKNENSSGNSSAKFTQYYNQGKELYEKNCSNCHQKNGTGLGRLYPPVNVSEFLDKNPDEVICIMRYGKKGELIVNGVSFNQPMPGVPSLTDLEVAEIATYLYNSWGRQHGIIEAKGVSIIAEKCMTPE